MADWSGQLGRAGNARGVWMRADSLIEHIPSFPGDLSEDAIDEVSVGCAVADLEDEPTDTTPAVLSPNRAPATVPPFRARVVGPPSRPTPEPLYSEAPDPHEKTPPTFDMGLLPATYAEAEVTERSESMSLSMEPDLVSTRRDTPVHVPDPSLTLPPPPDFSVPLTVEQVDSDTLELLDDWLEPEPSDPTDERPTWVDGRLPEACATPTPPSVAVPREADARRSLLQVTPLPQTREPGAPQPGRSLAERAPSPGKSLATRAPHPRLQAAPRQSGPHTPNRSATPVPPVRSEAPRAQRAVVPALARQQSGGSDLGHSRPPHRAPVPSSAPELRSPASIAPRRSTARSTASRSSVARSTAASRMAHAHPAVRIAWWLAGASCGAFGATVLTGLTLVATFLV